MLLHEAAAGVSAGDMRSLDETRRLLALHPEPMQRATEPRSEAAVMYSRDCTKVSPPDKMYAPDEKG